MDRYAVTLFSPLRDIETEHNERDDTFTLPEARNLARQLRNQHADAIAVINDLRGDWADEYIGDNYDQACAIARSYHRG